ncbi:MAG: signal peptidase II [Clostridia bacterium]|nr:signal peptidase II [Clostridia bacterium]
MKKVHYMLGIMIVLIDQLLKIFYIGKNITIIPNVLNIEYTENIAGAFGIGKRYIVLTVSILIILGLIVYLIKENKKIPNYFPFILILAGSIGNLIDRIFRGYVIDFIDVSILNFPKFNIADISIVLGIFWLIILMIMKKEK